MKVYDPQLSQTHVFQPNPPGASGDVDFLFFQKLTSRPLGPLKGAPGPVRGPFGTHSGPVRAHLGPPEPGPAHAADGSAAAAGRTPSPGQAPLPSRPGTKYVAQGTLAAMFCKFHLPSKR